MRWKFVALIIFITCGYASARILNVPSDYPTIQAGIDASVNGDTILVAPGEYHENITLYARNILLSSLYGPDTTVINGEFAIGGQVDSTCIIRGFTILGTPSGPTSPMTIGAGVSLKVEANIYHASVFRDLGGAISCYGGNPIIRSNIIKYNYAVAKGGGVCFWNSSVLTSRAEVSFNIICGNRTGFTAYGDGHGGGIYLLGDAVIKYNLICDNQAVESILGGSGGGIEKIHVSDSRKTIIANNTIVSNVAKQGDSHGAGGGLYLSCSSPQESLIVKNNIFAFNTWGGNVRGVLNESLYLDWDYNLVYGDTSMGFPHGQHDIFLDPLFADTTIDNYHLLPDSPCIDAGDPSSPLDPDSTRADIGAYFYDQTVDISDPSEPIEPFQFQLLQNYPNPFNSNTVILYTLSETRAVSLQIFTVSGQLIRNLVRDQIQASGMHQIIWDSKDDKGKEVATGIYIYRLVVGRDSLARAMITIR